MTASELCLLGAGIFFGTGLLTGVWKYVAIDRSAGGEASAPIYVDIAHRASLLYSFAAILFLEFVPYSPVSPAATRWVVGVPLVFFGSAIATYVTHGVLRDTDNQLRRPHVLGHGTLPPVLVRGYMVALILGEVGGFGVLFYGFLQTVL
ncbi:MAG: hypothetical protein KC543_11030 [Myxococcales bacterium]|nr:hypothetical protein [Myxococcales bacterium]